MGKQTNVNKVKEIVSNNDKCYEGNRWVTRQ